MNKREKLIQTFIDDIDEDDDKYEVDTLHDPEDNDMIWSTFFYDDVRDIKEELEDGFKHVVPVKATIVVEDL